MLVIFDVDGTLIGGEPADWLAFDTAIESVLGFSADETFFFATNPHMRGPLPRVDSAHVSRER